MLQVRPTTRNVAGMITLWAVALLALRLTEAPTAPAQQIADKTPSAQVSAPLPQRPASVKKAGFFSKFRFPRTRAALKNVRS